MTSPATCSRARSSSASASRWASVPRAGRSASWPHQPRALVLRTPNSVQIIGLLILFPLTFTSNVFVDPQTMPRRLRAFVDVNPVSHLVTATRGLTDGTATATQIAWVLGASAILSAVFAPLAFRLYERS